jgi:hypothetical protein
MTEKKPLDAQPSKVPPRQKDLLRDPIWQFVGAIVAIAAIGISIVLFYLGQPKHELQVLEDISTSLVDVRPEAEGLIEIFYKGKAVPNVSLIQLRIRNSGNQAILPSGYVENLAFTFDSSIEIIDYLVTHTEPGNLGVVLSRTLPNKVEILPVLLNPGDSATIRFIVIGQGSQSTSNFSVTGRIKDIKDVTFLTAADIQKTSPTRVVIQLVLWLVVGWSGALMLLILVLVFLAVIGKATVARVNWVRIPVVFLVALGALVFSLWALFGNR